MGKLNSPTSVSPDILADAKALLEGKVPRSVRRPNDSAHRRARDFATTAEPSVSAEALFEAFPDRVEHDANDPYCEQSPLGRAIWEVVCDVVDCETGGLSHATGGYEEIRGPLYRHEIRQAQRRTLNRLLRMAEDAQEKADSNSVPPEEHDYTDDPTALVLAAESMLAGLNPPKTTGWELPRTTHGRVQEFFDPQPPRLEFGSLASFRAEDGLSPDEILAAEADDDKGFVDSPKLRRKAISKALNEALFLICENFEYTEWPQNAFLAHAMRMTYRRTLIELLGLWYQEERSTEWAPHS